MARMVDAINQNGKRAERLGWVAAIASVLSLVVSVVSLWAK